MNEVNDLREKKTACLESLFI